MTFTDAHTLELIAIAGGLFVIWLIPSAIALTRRHHQRLAIIVLDVFAPVIGAALTLVVEPLMHPGLIHSSLVWMSPVWFAALLWSVTAVRRGYIVDGTLAMITLAEPT